MLKLLQKYNVLKYKESLLKFSLAAVLLAVPLYPKFPFINVPGTYVAIRLEDFLIAIAAVAFLINFWSHPRDLIKNKIFIAILIYIFVSFVSLLSAVLITQTVSFSIGFLHWLRRVEYLICFFAAYECLKYKKDILFFIKCSLITIVYSFVYGLGQKIFFWPIITTQNDEYSKGVALRFIAGGHLVSTFAGHYDLASFVILILPLVILLFFSKDILIKNFELMQKPFLSRILLGLIALAGIWLLVNTASRISIFSYFVAVSIAMILAKKIKFLPIILIISIIFVSISTNLISRYTQIFDVYIKRIISNVSVVQVLAADEGLPQRRKESEPRTNPVAAILEDRSTSIRLAVEWPRAIRALRKNPLLGTGFSSITLASDNDYLRALGETGTIGFISFMLIFACLFLYLWKERVILKENSYSSLYVVAIFGSLPGIMLNATFIDIFEASKFAVLFWSLVGFAVKLIHLSKYEKQN